MIRAHKKEILTFPTVDIVAAGIIAFRQIGEEIKPDSYWSSENVTVKSNKAIALDILKNSPNQITQADRDEALAIIQNIQAEVTIGLLAGRKVSAFVLTLAKAVEEEISAEHKVGLLVYAPSVYEIAKQRDAMAEQLSASRYISKALGKAGDKVQVNFTLIKKNYVYSIQCFSATGTDEKGNLVQFLTNKEEMCQSHLLEGKIKTVGASQYHGGAIVTGLNYVKLPKK